MSNYIGGELGLFKQARNWKSYYWGLISPYLGTKVLEVGAGIGANTALFCNSGYARWMCLEPDPTMGRELNVQIREGKLPSCCEAVVGTVADMPEAEKFDSIIYIDVLEHILDDKEEIQRALRLLSGDGYLIVLSPAHQFLFSPFDESIGHFRRYTRKSLRKIVPAKIVTLRYLDAAGMALSLANRLLLKQAMPTLPQIQFWDKRVIPISRIIDRLLSYRVGKSVLGIWQAQR